MHLDGSAALIVTHTYVCTYIHRHTYTAMTFFKDRNFLVNLPLDFGTLKLTTLQVLLCQGRALSGAFYLKIHNCVLLCIAGQEGP